MTMTVKVSTAVEPHLSLRSLLTPVTPADVEALRNAKAIRECGPSTAAVGAACKEPLPQLTEIIDSILLTDTTATSKIRGNVRKVAKTAANIGGVQDLPAATRKTRGRTVSGMNAVFSTDLLL